METFKTSKEIGNIKWHCLHVLVSNKRAVTTCFFFCASSLSKKKILYVLQTVTAIGQRNGSDGYECSASCPGLSNVCEISTWVWDSKQDLEISQYKFLSYFTPSPCTLWCKKRLTGTCGDVCCLNRVCLRTVRQPSHVQQFYPTWIFLILKVL